MQLRLIDGGDLPQMYRPDEPEVFSPDVIKLTDRLHDTGDPAMLELAHDLLDQHTRTARLQRFCEFMLTPEITP